MLGSGRSRWNRVDGEQQPPAGDSHQTTHAVQRAEEDSPKSSQQGKKSRDGELPRGRTADGAADRKTRFGRSELGNRHDRRSAGRPQREADETGRSQGRQSQEGRPVRGRRDTDRRGSFGERPKRFRDEQDRDGSKTPVGERRPFRSRSGEGGRTAGPRKDEKFEVVKRGGARLAPKQERKPDPAIDADVTGLEIDRAIKNELRTLSKENAKGVGQHLVMVSRLLDVDINGARAHAETAVRRAGRVAAVREARGLVAYREGDYQMALSEFRTARRLSGSQHLLPLMVDCERGLGRPERALELAGSPEARTLTKAERIELLIVCSGIRRDMGHLDASVVLLETPDLNPNRRDPWSARLFYAYGEALMSRGDHELARAWFAEAADADTDNLTDAAERLDEIDGIVFVDLGEEENDLPGVSSVKNGADSAQEQDVQQTGHMR